MINAQQLTATVTGPDGANTMFVFDGILPFGLNAWNNTSSKETFSVLLGPQITRRQFDQATATAALSNFTLTPSGNSQISCQVSFVDADWDDESGKLELRIEVAVQAGANVSASVNSAGFHV